MHKMLTRGVKHIVSGSGPSGLGSCVGKSLIDGERTGGAKSLIDGERTGVPPAHCRGVLSPSISYATSPINCYTKRVH